MTPQMNIEPRLRTASWLIVAGVLVQAACLLTVHPLSFMAFALVGCPLVAAGSVFYLLSIVSHRH